MILLVANCLPLTSTAGLHGSCSKISVEMADPGKSVTRLSRDLAATCEPWSLLSLTSFTDEPLLAAAGFGCCSGAAVLVIFGVDCMSWPRRSNRSSILFLISWQKRCSECKPLNKMKSRTMSDGHICLVSMFNVLQLHSIMNRMIRETVEWWPIVVYQFNPWCVNGDDCKSCLNNQVDSCQCS